MVWPFEKDQVVHSARERLKDAAPEAAVEFALTALRLMLEERSWATYALNQVVGGVLRRCDFAPSQSGPQRKTHSNTFEMAWRL